MSRDKCLLQDVRVLVVDDEADAREILQFVLEWYGAEIRAVASAAEALEVIREWLPDVLVSDIGMPGEDGYALIRKLRASEAEREANIPALALTAFSRPEDRLRALSAGFQTHLAKPAEPDQLVAVVARLSAQK